MVFWLAILAGALFARAAITMGFYRAWTTLFNIVVAVYVAVFLTPVIIDAIPAAGDTWYGHVLTLIAVAAGTFAVLYGLSYACLGGEDNVTVPFPRVFEIVLASFLGFLGGFFAFSYVALLVCLTPLAQDAFVRQYGLDREGQQTNVAYICWWCDLVHAAVAYPESDASTEQVLAVLEKSAQERIEPPRPAPPKTEDTTEESTPPTPASEESAAAPAT